MKFLFIPKTHDISIVDVVTKKNLTIVHFNNGVERASLPATEVTNDFVLEFYSKGKIEDAHILDELVNHIDNLLHTSTARTIESESFSVQQFNGRTVVYYHYKPINYKTQSILAKNYRDALDMLGLTESLFSIPKYKLMKGLAYLKNEKLVLGKRKAGDDNCPGIDGVFEHQLFSLMVLKSA